MQREIYTYEQIAAGERRREQRERALQRLIATAPKTRRRFARRTAHWLGGLLLALGARLRAYGLHHPDTRTGADLRYS